MAVNFSKFRVTRLKKDSKLTGQYALDIYGNEIVSNKSVKLLGIHIYHKLSLMK